MATVGYQLGTRAMRQLQALVRASGRTNSLESVRNGRAVRLGQTVSLLVTGWSSDGTRFRCSRLDPHGLPIGTPFEVRAVSYPSIGGVIGKQDLRACSPRIDVGEIVEASYRAVATGDASPHVLDWWAVPIFDAGGAGGKRWAKVISRGASTFEAKFVDGNGNETGDRFTVRVLVAAADGKVKTGVPLNNVEPVLTVGDKVWVQYAPAAGALLPAGYYLADMAHEACN